MSTRNRLSAPAGPSSLPPFERIIEIHGRTLLRFSAAQVGANRAEDVFQESMLAALRAYAGVRDPASIRSGLYSIAARKAIDSHRARARAPEPVADPAPPPVEDVPYPDEAIWKAVRSLPGKQRQAVTLRFLGNLSHREIDVRLGLVLEYGLAHRAPVEYVNQHRLCA